MVGVPLFAFMDEEGRVSVREKLARRRNGIREEHEHKLMNRDGAAVWARLSVSPIMDASGEYRGAIALVTDITERRRVEAELRETTARFQHLFESTSDAVAFFDVKTFEILDANDAALELYGYTWDELSKVPIVDITSDPETARTLLSLAVPGSTLRNPLRWHRRLDGSIFPVELTTGAFDQDGRLVGYAIVRDITARIEAEKALRWEHDHARSLIRAVQDGLVESDLDGVITEVNDEFCAMTGFTRDELLGSRPPHGYWPEKLRGAYMNATTKVIAGAEGTWEMTLRRSDGQQFPAVVAAATMRDGDGAAVGYLGMFRDVSERRQAEVALHHAELERHRQAAELERHRLEAQLAQTQRLESLGRLAGGIAHDFNNQLGVILNYASFVGRRHPPESPGAADVTAIQQAAERAADLTRQLLLFARHGTPNRTVFDLNTVAQETVDLVRRPIGPRTEIVLHLASEPCVVDSDQTQIEQMLMNLVLNARDATPNGGTITVSTTVRSFPVDGVADLEPGQYVLLTVADNGVGMAPEVATRAFEPFFTTKAQEGGSGLGLATAHGVVTGSGGHIAVDSEPGRGTELRVYLPAAVMSRAAQPSSGRNEMVLVVDDEPDVRAMTARILRDAGYSVIEAASGRDALDHPQTPDVDVVVTDVLMPGMYGDELARRLLKARPDFKFLFMSGHTSHISPDALPGNLIEKPFRADGLLRAISLVIDGHPALAR
jgi:two-component system cell cycle sensor histidine kinase/response regulator CckA